jgi:hypothetical protein
VTTHTTNTRSTAWRSAKPITSILDWALSGSKRRYR